MKHDIYGFKNEIEEIRYGKNKGTYSCILLYRKNSSIENGTLSDTIYVNEN